MKKLIASTLKIKQLTESDQKIMYQLFTSCYQNTSQAKFLADLHNKERVIILRDQQTKEIKGFSTLKEVTVKINHKNVYGLFSGDTIISPDYWGQTALSMEFFKNLIKTKLKHPFSAFYWFLISKGFKTYLLLSNNFETYYPRYDRDLPAIKKEIIKGFANSLYPNQFDAKSLLIKLTGKSDHLKRNIAPISNQERQNPKICFFEEMNPDWQSGDELCCIGKVDFGLIRKYLSRTFRKSFSRENFRQKIIVN